LQGFLLQVEVSEIVVAGARQWPAAGPKAYRFGEDPTGDVCEEETRSCGRSASTAPGCTMKICVAGEGAFGQKHLDALKRIPGVEVTCLVGGNQRATAEVAKKYAIPHHTGDLGEGIERGDGVILTTPTPLHRQQAEQVMRARKHVLIEIPIRQC
jgi:Oxidoreductase family, NAD-binding Rossmann fold